MNLNVIGIILFFLLLSLVLYSMHIAQSVIVVLNLVAIVLFFAMLFLIGGKFKQRIDEIYDGFFQQSIDSKLMFMLYLLYLVGESSQNLKFLLFFGPFLSIFVLNYYFHQIPKNRPDKIWLNIYIFLVISVLLLFILQLTGR